MQASVDVDIQVDIRASFRYLDKKRVQRIIEPSLDRAFMKLSLSDIKQSLEAHPWIASASVQRKWPNVLEIQFSEEDPIAQWADSGYLNRYGELFLTEPVSDLPLPQLYFASEYSHDKAKHYAQLTAMLSRFDLRLVRLDVDATGLHQLQLASTTGPASPIGASEKNTFVVVADEPALMSRLERFGQIYQQAIKGSTKRIARADLRYEKGLAVSWYEKDTIAGLYAPSKLSSLDNSSR